MSPWGPSAVAPRGLDLCPAPEATCCLRLPFNDCCEKPEGRICPIIVNAVGTNEADNGAIWHGIVDRRSRVRFPLADTVWAPRGTSPFHTLLPVVPEHSLSRNVEPRTLRTPLDQQLSENTALRVRASDAPRRPMA
eukprot:358829-Chlamydomonas_euryale.AAC.15